MIATIRVVLGVGLLAAAGGCAVEPPNWCWPGDSVTQIERAKVYDPFPDPDIGPPVEGFRPREYDTPRTDTHPDRRIPRY